MLIRVVRAGLTLVFFEGFAVGGRIGFGFREVWLKRGFLKPFMWSYYQGEG